jgi:rod shape-determining protein MreB and related proteins
MKALKQLREKIFSFLSNDIGIDLGTANTLVYLKGKGIVINEPSVVAVNQKTGRVVAVGKQAKEMVGRTPGHIIAITPLVDGVISDFEVTEEMLSYLINKAQKDDPKLLGPRVVVGVPSGITNVEIRAVRDAAKNAGAREVHIIEEPMAAALSVRLPVRDAIGSMVIDIGGGTSDIAVISLGGIVRSKNVRVAGNKLNDDIIIYVRSEFKMLIGEKTAEELKLAVGSVYTNRGPIEATIRGRDLVSGLPREIILSDSDVREAISGSIDSIIDATKEVLETTPPEILSDIMRQGVYLAGGGALLKGLPELFHSFLKVPVYTIEEPLTCVARGAGIVLESLEDSAELLSTGDDEQLSPTA